MEGAGEESEAEEDEGCGNEVSVDGGDRGEPSGRRREASGFYFFYFSFFVEEKYVRVEIDPGHGHPK